MMRVQRLCWVAVLAVLGRADTAFAQERGPYTDDLVKSTWPRGARIGLGAPVSEPDHGQGTGPNASQDARSTRSHRPVPMRPDARSFPDQLSSSLSQYR